MKKKLSTLFKVAAISTALVNSTGCTAIIISALASNSNNEKVIIKATPEKEIKLASIKTNALPPQDKPKKAKQKTVRFVLKAENTAWVMEPSYSNTTMSSALFNVMASPELAAKAYKIPAHTSKFLKDCPKSFSSPPDYELNIYHRFMRETFQCLKEKTLIAQASANTLAEGYEAGFSNKEEVQALFNCKDLLGYKKHHKFNYEEALDVGNCVFQAVYPKTKHKP